jgi:DNA-binding response OmpR family regulator
VLKVSVMTIHGARVLVAEDDYLCASDLSDELRRAGACVIGPVPTASDAIALLDSGIDLVVLDVQLRGEIAMPVAQAADRRLIPFVVVSGYEESLFPELLDLAEAWYVKPVAFVSVSARIDALLAQQAS